MPRWRLSSALSSVSSRRTSSNNFEDSASTQSAHSAERTHTKSPSQDTTASRSQEAEAMQAVQQVPKTAPEPAKPPKAAMQVTQKVPNGPREQVKPLNGDSELSDSDTQVNSPTNAKNRDVSLQVHQVARETTTVKRRLISELDGVNQAYFDHFDLDQYLSYIADERLIHMPGRGSPWDRVLMEAEFFGLQLSSFADTVGFFVANAATACDTALASCYLLLELGSHQAAALEPTFNALYELGCLLMQCTRLQGLFGATEDIRHDLGDVFAELVRLVGHVAVHYRQRINRLSAGAGAATIDFDGVFGRAITAVWAKRERLANHMWAYRLRDRAFATGVEEVRRDLGQGDQSVRSTLYGRVADRGLRAPGTCEWLQPHLVDFLRSGEHLLAVTGVEGAGKSIMASWIRERMIRPISHKNHEVISYTFADDAPGQSTPVAFLKGLLYQLFESNVGDVRFFEKLAAAYEKQQQQPDGPEVEAALWDALEAGIRTVDEYHVNLIIIVDALDEIVGGEEMAGVLYKHLGECVAKFGHVRAITLSRPLAKIRGQGKQLEITAEDTVDDMTKFVVHYLQKNHSHLDQSGQKEAIARLVVSKAKGSYLWAVLTLELLPNHAKYEAIHKEIEGRDPHPFHTFHRHLERMDQKDPRPKHILSYMCVAERPLAVEEMQALLSADPAKGTMTSGVDVQKLVEGNIRYLVVVRRGLLRFRHSSVRRFMIDLCGKLLPSLEDVHKEFTLRLLLFARSTFLKGYEQPSFERLGQGPVEQMFREHSLNEYVVRRWIQHFRSSSLYDPQQKHPGLEPALRNVFPGLVFLPLLEWSAWSLHAPPERAVEWHELALHVRHAVLGDKHPATLQSLIILAHLYRQLSRWETSAEYFYRASETGQAVLPRFSPIVISCTQAFLGLTETMTFTKRTAIVTYRERMIRLMIEITKGRGGQQSDEVMRWYEALKQLYVSIREEDMAVAVYKELHAIVVARFGHGSARDQAISRDMTDFKVPITKDQPEKEIDQIRDLFSGFDRLEVSEVRVDLLLRLALAYEKQKKWLLAEKLYIYLWQHVSESCRRGATRELHEHKLTIALRYVGFLKQQKRTEEARGILIFISNEYRDQKLESDVIAARLKEVAVWCKSFGLTFVSMSLLRKVWGWFKDSKSTEKAEAQETTVLLSEVVEEITEKEETKKKTTTTTMETTVVEVYEMWYQRARTGKADGHFYKVAVSLLDYYIKLENWAEATKTSRQCLELTWKQVLTSDSKLTGEFTAERIRVAARLALCYQRQRLYEKSEEIWLRIFHACIGSFAVDDARTLEAYASLVAFYQDFHRYDRVIGIHQTLLVRYRKDLAKDHRLTIQALYALADVYMLLGRREAFECYIEVMAILNDKDHCHADAVRAGLAVLTHYHQEERWAELEQLSRVMWNTFAHRHKDVLFTEKDVQLIYERYRFVLEHHSKTEKTYLYTLSLEYRDTVAKAFKGSLTMLIGAMIALAEVCELFADRQEEAIHIYEEVITRTKSTTTTTTTTTTVSETTIRTAKRRLATLYVAVVQKGKTAASKETVARGATVCYEAYEQLRLELGWYHEATLAKLRELALLYRRQGTEAARARMLQVLQNTAVHVVTEVTDTAVLYQTATRLGALYVEVGLAAEARALLTQLRYALVLHEEQQTLVRKRLTRAAIVFLVALEQHVLAHSDGEKAASGSAVATVSYSELVADLLLEMVLYEQYAAAVTSGAGAESDAFLVPAARLRAFWAGHRVTRDGFVAALDRKVEPLFAARYRHALGGADAADADAGQRRAVSDWYAALLEGVGAAAAAGGGVERPVDLAGAATRAAGAGVRGLLAGAEFGRAAALAGVAFRFCHALAYFRERRCAVEGFRLAEMLAGVGVAGWARADAGSREAMVRTSGEVVGVVLGAFREAGVEVVSLSLEDLDRLVRLLGTLRRFEDLEYILTALFGSREVQKTWSPDIVLRIGTLLVDAHATSGHLDRAAALCDRLWYNVRQSRGAVDVDALALADKLARLLARSGATRDALAVHEDVLRELDEAGDVRVGSQAHNGSATAADGKPSGRPDDDDRRAGLRLAAARHLLGMQRVVRARGGWAGGARPPAELYRRLSRFGDLGVPGPERWGADRDEAADRAAEEADRAAVEGPAEWRLVPEGLDQREAKKRDFVMPARERWGCWAVGSEAVEAGGAPVLEVGKAR